MGVELSDHELRVFGVLIEKSLTQPDSYPLTMNAIRLGASQKQNRNPVAEYTEADVSRAVYALQQKDLVEQAPPVPGARANRFAHRANEVLHWDRREQAIMAELMLRGRQTAGELRSRASRMTPLRDSESVAAVLEDMKRGDPPVVEELAREPGRSANRYRHLLGGSDRGGVSDAVQVYGTPPATRSAMPPGAPATAPPAAHDALPADATASRPSACDAGQGVDAGSVASLVRRVASLERRVDELFRIVAPRAAGDAADPGRTTENDGDDPVDADVGGIHPC